MKILAKGVSPATKQNKLKNVDFFSGTIATPTVKNETVENSMKNSLGLVGAPYFRDGRPSKPSLQH